MTKVMTRLPRWVTGLATAALFSCILASAQVAVTTYHNDNYRSGANTREAVLTPANVNVATFGRRLQLEVQGQVYAQPLYVPGVEMAGTVHNVVYVATEHLQVYAFDANSGEQLWNTSFIEKVDFGTIQPVTSAELECPDLAPEVGITGTPVIDVASNTLYVVAKVKMVETLTGEISYDQVLHALDITTGRDRVPPHHITAVSDGVGAGSVDGKLTFDPFVQLQRPALLLNNGQVVVAWASHCDMGLGHGYVMAFDKTSLAASGVFMSTPNGAYGGFWGGGAGPAADFDGAIYIASGNGAFTANTRAGRDYGDSILRLKWSLEKFAVSDFFTPWNQAALNANDSDLGSGGVLLLPDQPDARYPHLLVQAGKEGTINLIDRDDMGRWRRNNDSQIVQTLPRKLNGVYGAPAFWNNNVYFGSTADYVQAYNYDPALQTLSAQYTSRTPELFVFPAPTPSVSANGPSNGIVWVIQSDMNNFPNAVLRAYDANDLGRELYNSEQYAARDRAGPAVKFTVPTIADGQVFVGSQNEVDVYGILGEPLPGDELNGFF